MCSRAELDGLLTEFADGAKEIFNDKLKDVILFGSYARGDCDSESDVDIAILADIKRGEERKYSKQLVNILGDIYEKHGYSAVLSPIIINADFFEEWKNSMPFYRNITKDGVSVLGKNTPFEEIVEND